MSAFLQISLKFFVLLWQIVTVASSFISIKARGFPTILLLPIITQCLPTREIFSLWKISMIPAGVQGKSFVWFVKRFPMVEEWNASTSFSGKILSVIFFWLIWEGRGNWTRIPFIFLSWFNFSIKLMISFSEVSSGK